MVIYKTQADPIQIEIAIEIGIEKQASRRAKMTLKYSPPLNRVDYDTDSDFDPDAA
jgi:hypothetical protein